MTEMCELFNEALSPQKNIEKMVKFGYNLEQLEDVNKFYSPN
jgi:hypothetical protein